MKIIFEKEGQKIDALKLRVKVTHIEANNNKFDAFKVLTIKKQWVDLRFTQAVKNQPTEDCYIVVKPDKINYSTKNLYPRFWVKEILQIMPLENKAKDATEFFE